MRWRSWLALGLLPVFALQAESPDLRELQPLIDRASPGGIVKPAAGRYRGPIHIDKPLTLDGAGQVTVVGHGHGTVVSVRGTEVSVRGLTIQASGESHDAIDAGILVEGERHRIENNVLDDVLFGVHLRQASRSVVRGNRITGKVRDASLRGDAIRMWNGTGNGIENNEFRRARDLTFINSPDNRVTGNRFTDGRYGMQIVFSPRLLVENNTISEMGTGIVVLYSRDVVLRGNHVAHALTGGGAGIVFKESDTGLVEGNTVLHCTVGLKVDAPPEPVGVLAVTGNRFAHNITGLYFYGEAGGHHFSANRFDNNLNTVAISGPGAGAANVWKANHWDDYQGFDLDHDGIGDTPHEVWMYADRIWMETPVTLFFRNSPSFELLDFLERLAPFSSPHKILHDDAPRMR